MTMREREALRRANEAMRRRRIEHRRKVRPAMPWGEYVYAGAMVALGAIVLFAIAWGIVNHA